MVLVIVITKEGLFKNEIVNDLQQLYKCCNYKSNKGFIKLYEWDNYELWGKIKGKISNEIFYFKGFIQVTRSLDLFHNPMEIQSSNQKKFNLTFGVMISMMVATWEIHMTFSTMCI